MIELLFAALQWTATAKDLGLTTQRDYSVAEVTDLRLDTATIDTIQPAANANRLGIGQPRD